MFMKHQVAFCPRDTTDSLFNSSKLFGDDLIIRDVFGRPVITGTLGGQKDRVPETKKQPTEVTSEKEFFHFFLPRHIQDISKTRKST